MRFSTALCLFISLLLFTGSSAQTAFDKLDSVAGVFKTFLDNNEKEKIIVETDRKLYVAGEKIWFKAFVVNAATGKIDLSSKNLFTDFVDDHDNIIAKLILNNAQLSTNGAISLPETLISGFYWLRSYTAKMLTEDTGSIFVQPLYIYNSKMPDTVNYNKAHAIAINNGVSPVIHFFPERLSGVPPVSSIGVLQITDADNNPLSVSGRIVDNNNSLITGFTTNRFGLARIAFVDDPILKYTAVVHIDGSDIQYPLPPVDHFAAQLSVSNQANESIKAFVTLEDSLPPNYRTIILGINHDSLCYAAIGTGTYGINIPLDNFPGGINSLLLFDEQKHLLSERKIFIDRDNYIVDLKANKKNYAARDKATLDIKVTDTKNNPLVTALNISVQDVWLTQLFDSIEADELPASNEFLLNNWLMLHHDKYSQADIDLLMVTIKSLYNEAANDNKIGKTAYNDDNEKLLNFSGRITDRKDRPLKDRVLTVISKNKDGLFADADTTNDSGFFKIPLPQNMDSLSLSLQVTDKHGVIRKEDKINTDSFNFPHFATPVSLKQAFFSYSITAAAYIKKYHIDTSFILQGKGWLKPVTVTTPEKKALNYDVSRRFTMLSQIVTSDKFNSGFDALVNALLLVPGVSLRGDISIYGGGKPLLIMDGSQVYLPEYATAIDFLNSLQPGDIDFIEVLRGGEAAIYGNRAGNGVILINSRRGPADMYSNEKSDLVSFTPLTYHVSPRFFMPDYSSADIKNSKIPDPRTTIYWNSNTLTNINGQASVNFYTADNATNYTVTITGLTAKGDIIYKRISISRN